MYENEKAIKEITRFLKIAGEVCINVVVVIFNYYMRALGVREVKVKSTGGALRFSFGESAEASVDERIAKIDAARTSLTEALSAIDELKQRAEENKQDLEFLTQQIERAEIDRDYLSGELETLKGLAALDSESVRRTLKLPTRVSIWTERVIAFLFGVVASTVASLLYEYVVKKFI